MAKDVEFTGQSGASWRYWSDQPLGRPGGFGGVYAGEAFDGTSMAIKVVEKNRPSGVLDDRLLRREVEIGHRVAESSAELLLPVIDVADEGDRLLLVMVRADEALADHSLPFDEVTTIAAMTDIVAGLQELHAIGILHRDLKPANVLAHGGRWKLADFGIARDEEIGTQTLTFVGWGSPPYMAPEVWGARRPTVKTDLYALGCVGYQLLSDAPPFTGDKAGLRHAHLTQSPPDAPTANVVLGNLIARLLAKEPGARPQDARAVLERLQRAALPLNRVQVSLAKGIGVHAAERSLEASHRAAQEAARETRRQQVAQALADLDEILADTLEDLHQVEPDATLDTPRPLGRATKALGRSSITLATPDATLRIDPWEQGSYGAVVGDTMILACSVEIRNRRYERDLSAANLVYEQIGDRFGWQAYRFQAGMIAPNNYRYGPYGRTHGLSHEDFFGQYGRYFMIHSAMHTWQKSVVPLTTESVLDLFREAVDLRPPDPRTGLWAGA
jgi:serine/threonine-protein kinase